MIKHFNYTILMNQVEDVILGEILGFHHFHLHLNDPATDLIWQEQIYLIFLLWLLLFKRVCLRTPKSLHLFLQFG